jgi:lysozyme
MKESGIKVRGAYHFGHSNDNAQTQATYFLGQVGATGPGDFLVLDIEASDKQSPTRVADFSAEFCKIVHNATKRPVFVYTGEWFWDPQAGGSSKCADFPLWVAGYSSSPPMPKGWKKWTFWQ